MRYVFLHDDSTLNRSDGSKMYGPNRNGVLIVGDPTTKAGAGNYVDAAIVPLIGGKQLMRFFPTDLAGTTTACDEMCGKANLSGNGLSSLAANEGHWWAEAPILATGAGTVGCYEGVCYEVLSGSVVYNDYTYNKGEFFAAGLDNGSLCALTSGDGTFALSFCTNECTAFLSELFAINELQTGRESVNYWDYTEGYEAMNSSCYNDDNFTGSQDL